MPQKVLKQDLKSELLEELDERLKKYDEEKSRQMEEFLAKMELVLAENATLRQENKLLKQKLDQMELYQKEIGYHQGPSNHRSMTGNRPRTREETNPDRSLKSKTYAEVAKKGQNGKTKFDSQLFVKHNPVKIEHIYSRINKSKHDNIQARKFEARKALASIGIVKGVRTMSFIGKSIVHLLVDEEDAKHIRGRLNQVNMLMEDFDPFKPAPHEEDMQDITCKKALERLSILYLNQRSNGMKNAIKAVVPTTHENTFNMLIVKKEQEQQEWLTRQKSTTEKPSTEKPGTNTSQQ